MSDGVTLHGSRGSIVAKPGDVFDWWDGSKWEIVSFTGDRIYSPSGLGGTPIVVCKLVGGKPNAITATYTQGDGLCEWCGDSVASALLKSPLTTAARSALSDTTGEE